MAAGRPYWETLFPKEVWPAFEDFRNFLTLVWAHLGLPPPTQAQYEIAHRLQWGVDSFEWEGISELNRGSFSRDPRQDIIRAFRGIGKSYITCAYVAWRLMRNPRDEKVLVVSATSPKAKAFVNQLQSILKTMPLLKFLMEGPRDKGVPRRDQQDRFDVAFSSLSQSPSVRAAAVLGQVTGDRATLIVADDIEIPQNSASEDARTRLLNICREFGMIVKTEHGKGDIIFLGTPQTEESVYNRMIVEQGFTCFTVPIRFPYEEKLKNYTLQRQDGRPIDILAPYLRGQYHNGALKPGDLTDPKRFTYEELAKEEMKGKAYFALQMMLDTSLSDAERYPLKQHDLIVMSTNNTKGPLTVQWGHDTDKKNYIRDIPNIGFSGDHFLRPLMIDSEWTWYEGAALYVDPAGRGKDETAWAIVKSLNGLLYCLKVGGWAGDPAEAMIRIATDAKAYNVNIIEVEPNYGQGMWITAFQPVLQKVWPGGCTVQESEWSRTQKEIRIIDILEPVLTQHRLIMDESVVRTNATMTGEDLRYSLLYQLTHITRDRGSLNHDDRLEALAGAVYHFMRSAGQDIDEAAQALRDHQMDLEIEAFVESYNRPQQRVPRRRMNIVGDPASLDDNAWIFEKGYDGSLWYYERS